MAINVDISKIAGINQVGNSYQRKSAVPLDYYSLFNSKAEAEAYAVSNPVAYVGQIISYIDNNEVKVCYIADAAGTLKQVGTAPNGDNKTTEVTADGVIALLGAKNAANGTLPIIGEDGKLTWKTLEQVGAGDGNDNTTYEFSFADQEITIKPLLNGQPIKTKDDEGNETEEIVTHVLNLSTFVTTDELSEALSQLPEDKDTTYSIKEGEKVLKLEGTEFSSELGLSYANNRISLTGIDGEEIAGFDASEFVADGVLQDVIYNPATRDLIFIWNIVVGTEGGEIAYKTDTINIGDLVDTYTAGNGLLVNDNEFSIKLAADSESFLSVDTNGLKLTGIQSAIDAAKQAAIDDAKQYAKASDTHTKSEIAALLEAKANVSDVYNKNEVYTKGEADQAIADKISEVNGGESAGEVLGQLNAYKKIVNMEVWGNEAADGDSRIDSLAAKLATIAEGAQVNVIEKIVAADNAHLTVNVNNKTVTIDDSNLQSNIQANSDAIAAITNIDTGILAQANKHTNDSIAALLVKGVDDKTIKLNEGKAYVAEVSTDLLVQGAIELHLVAGDASI